MKYSFKCPICNAELKARKVVEIKYDPSPVLYFLTCWTCNIYGSSSCSCTNACNSHDHYQQAYRNLTEGANFLKDFILKGGFSYG